MRFWQGQAFLHRESIAFMLACPLLAAIPMAVEMVQHVAEMQTGFYNGLEGPAAAENHPARMILGYAKSIAMFLPVFWATRFFAGGRDAAAARRFPTRALALFMPVLAVHAAYVALSLFAIPTDGAWLLGSFALGMILTPLLVRWQVAAPLGIYVSPLASIAHVARYLPWAVGFAFVGMMPLMVLHYAFGIGALFVPVPAQWALMVADSVLVGWLAIVLTAANWVIATRTAPLAARDTEPDAVVPRYG